MKAMTNRERILATLRGEAIEGERRSFRECTTEALDLLVTHAVVDRDGSRRVLAATQDGSWQFRQAIAGDMLSDVSGN